MNTVRDITYIYIIVTEKKICYPRGSHFEHLLLTHIVIKKTKTFSQQYSQSAYSDDFYKD